MGRCIGGRRNQHDRVKYRSTQFLGMVIGAPGAASSMAPRSRVRVVVVGASVELSSGVRTTVRSARDGAVLVALAGSESRGWEREWGRGSRRVHNSLFGFGPSAQRWGRVQNPPLKEGVLNPPLLSPGSLAGGTGPELCGVDPSCGPERVCCGVGGERCEAGVGRAQRVGAV
jgi:hypothetical protein